jgi:hypothetical protein
MKTDTSLPHSQQPATCPYHDPDSSNPIHIPFKIDFNIILPSTSSTWFPSFFLQISLPKPCIYFSSPTYVTHAPSLLRILLDLIK